MCKNTFRIEKENLTLKISQLDEILKKDNETLKVIESQIKYPVNYIYKKYSIDSAQFDKSNAYYSANVEIYSSIYDSVKFISPLWFVSNSVLVRL